MQSTMYSKHAEKYDQAVQDNIYNAHFERPSLQSLLGDLNGCNVLDLGCGSGIYADYLLSKDVKNLTCVDFSEDMINLVQAKFGDQLSAYVQDLSAGLPNEKSDSFDVIICPLVIHYIEDLTKLFQEVSRVLKPDGYMAFSTHHPFADFDYSWTRNYFKRELVNDTWDTIGEPVDVTFYRRSLSEITDAITSNNLAITRLSEGKVSEKIKDLSEKHYEHLMNNPNFIFIRCDKPS